MSNENTQVKDLTEMERMVLGGSANLLFNLLNNQIYHIEHHDPTLTNLLASDEKAQEEFILMKNFRDIALGLSKIFGKTFDSMSDEERDSLDKPGTILEVICQEICHAVSCGK